ncbi:hypothetical protein [Natrinema halophilum]|uniref:hypothetical protein n=1 Tax=Natrinema halophilum TaxID=1699371 RepID=UPI001F215E6A|nr:hypothetical protein [Natrinema halophilum]UHQ96100.1 hypothetical protein HYG82_22490 [Natrinema halophilum]
MLVVPSGQQHPNRGLANLDSLLELLTEHDVLISLYFTSIPNGMQDEAGGRMIDDRKR